MIEATKIPIPFKLVQAEDFTNWQGDTAVEAWRRLMLQVRQMTGAKAREAAASDLPTQQIADLPNPPARPSQAFGSQIAGFAIVASLGVWFMNSGKLSVIFAFTIGVALLVLVLFRIAESDISPRMRALAAQWLLPRQNGIRVNTAEALNHIFEAIFGSEHFSAFCFVRATVVSVLLLGLLLVLARTVLGATVHFNAGVWISLAFYAGCVNVVGDYFALYCTRIMLRLFKKGVDIIVVLLLDFIITSAIFVCTIGVGIFVIYAVSVLNHNTSILQGDTLAGAVLHNLTRVIMQPYLGIFDPTSPDLLPVGQQRLIYASAITTFMTTIWLWAALLLSPIVRLLVWAGGTGLTTIGFVFDVYNAPFAALGYLAALIILFAGSSAWGASVLIASILK
jgi:hypothetical protein